MITDSKICAGYRGVGGKDSCTGDSGGPLVCNQNGNAILTGVVSYGIGCGNSKYPGVYSRVTHILDWIISNMVIQTSRNLLKWEAEDIVSKIRVSLEVNTKYFLI